MRHWVSSGRYVGSENVSQLWIEPEARPRLNQLARSADVPCVNESGTT